MNTHSKVFFVLRTELEETETESKSRRNLCLLKNTEREMATLDSDVPMVAAGESSCSHGPSSSKKPKRFEIKKWNAVSLWAWGLSLSLNPLPNPNFLLLYLLFLTILLLFIVVLVFCNVDIVVDNCAICRNHIMDLCKHVISVLLLL